MAKLLRKKRKRKWTVEREQSTHSRRLNEGLSTEFPVGSQD